MTFLYLLKAGFDPYGRSRKLYSATSIGRSPAGRRPRRFEAYGHSIVRYSVWTSSIRPASSSSTFTPAIASWNAAMPPAAPLPTTMTSQRSLVGVIESASRFDSSSARVRLTLSVGSSCMVFLPAVRAVLAVFGLAADELAQELIALVAKLVVNADSRGVVAADGRLLGHHEERFERRLRRLLVAADRLEDRVDLGVAKPAERRAEPRHRFGVERRQPAEPLQ